MTHSIRRLAVLVAVLIAVSAAAVLSACTDEIPSAPPAAEHQSSAAADTAELLIPGAELATSQSLTHQARQETALTYGISEQRDLRLPKIYNASHVVGLDHGQAVSLLLTCSDERRLSIEGLQPPPSVQRRGALLFRLDDHPAQTLDVSLPRFQSYGPDGSAELASIHLEDAVWYEALRAGERLTVQLLDSGQPPITFHLDRLFGTIFQDTFDSCDGSGAAHTSVVSVEPTAADRAAETLVPDAVAAASDALPHQARPAFTFHYGVTEQSHVLSPQPHFYAVYTVRDAASGFRDVSLNLTCDSQGRGLTIYGLQPASEHDRGTLLFAVDDLPPQALGVPLQRLNAYGPDGQSEVASVGLGDAAWYELLRGGSLLTVQLRGSEQAPITFDLTQLFGTIFQDTFDQCGDASVADASG